MEPYKTAIKLEYPDLKQKFKEHIDDGNNSRILFTAPFGSGKSTFLRDFFAEDRNKEYIFVNLYPVNYAVAANEDVFELIKFDILTDLLIKYSNEIPSLKREDFALVLKAQVFALHREESGNFLKSIISASSKTGKSVIAILEAIKELRNGFQDFENSAGKQEQINLESYLNEFNDQKGSIHEMDDISYHIYQLINELKTEITNTTTSRDNLEQGLQIRKTVLIIDDLDRLDPDHIFRLFNVFSAHYDSVLDRNKFGFDKIILVCDINNIHKMYSNRYGLGVDFSGYMDKYYSSKPFEFDSKTYIVEKIDEFIHRKPWVIPQHLNQRVTSDSYIKAYQKIMLMSLIYADKLSLRILDQSENYVYPKSFKIKLSGFFREYSPSYINFFVLIDYLRTLYPSLSHLQSSLSSLGDYYNDEFVSQKLGDTMPDRIFTHIIKECLIFLLPKDEIFNDNYLTEDEKKAVYYYHFLDESNLCYIGYMLEEVAQNYNRLRHPRLIL